MKNILVLAGAFVVVSATADVVVNSWNNSVTDGIWTDSSAWRETSSYPLAAGTAARFAAPPGGGTAAVALPDASGGLDHFHVLMMPGSSYIFDGEDGIFAMGALNDGSVRGLDAAGGASRPFLVADEGSAAASLALAGTSAEGSGGAVLSWSNAWFSVWSDAHGYVRSVFGRGLFDFDPDRADAWTLSLGADALVRSETLVTNATVACSALDAAFRAAENVLTVGKGGTVTSYGTMSFGYNLASSDDQAATNRLTVTDGGRFVYENGGENSTTDVFGLGSWATPHRRNVVSFTGSGTTVDLRNAYCSVFNGNTDVSFSDGVKVYMGRYSGLGNLYASRSSAAAYETLLTVSGDETEVLLPGGATFYVGSASGANASNRVVMTGGAIRPLDPSGTGKTALSIAGQSKDDKKIAHGVFELRGGSVDLWVAGNTNPDVNCSASIGPGNGLFKMSGGTLVCGDFYVGQNQPANYTEGQVEHVQRLHMTGGTIDCSRLYLGSGNKLEAYKYQKAHVDLDGGVLMLKRTDFNDAASSGGHARGFFTADGGTIRAKTNNGNLLSGFGTAELGPKGLTIDNAGFTATVSQSFTDKEGEAGCLTFTGSSTTTFNPVRGYTVSSTVVKGGTLTFPTNMTLETRLVIDGGATLSLVGTPGRLTVDALNVPRGTVYLDPGDTIHVTSDEVDFRGLTVRFSTTPAADSVYDVFTFDGDVSGNAIVRNALRFLTVGNAVSGYHAAFTLSYDAASGKTTVKTAYAEDSDPVTETTSWKGPSWDDAGWSDGVPTAAKVASFSDPAAPASVPVASAAEAGALSFTSGTGYLFTGDLLDITAAKGGSWFEMTSGSATFGLSVGLYHPLPMTLAAGTSATFNEPVVGGSVVKTGKGKLTLAADNDFRYALSVGGGLTVAAAAGALDTSAGEVTFTEDTLVFTNAAGGGEMVISPSVTLSSAVSATNALVLRSDSDVRFRSLDVERGALVKRGAGRLMVEASSSANTTLYAGYGPTSQSLNYRVVSSALVEFAADGTAPAPEDRQYAGFNVAEGEMVIAGEPGVSKQVKLVTGCCIGMNVAGAAAAFAQPVLTVDGADVDAYGQGHTTVGLPGCGKEGCAVVRPALRVLDGGCFHAGNIRLGTGANSAGAYPTLAVTNAQALAANAIRFEVIGGAADRGCIVRARNSTVAVTGTGEGHHGIFVSGGVDADFDGCLVGGTAQIGKLSLEKESAGTLRFRNGSVFAAFPYNIHASASYDLTLVFDDAEWRWGGGDKTLSYVTSSGDGFYKSRRFVKTEGTGLVLKPDAGCTFTTEVPFGGTGGLVAAGEGTVAFRGDTLRFTGLLDIRSGTVDLTEATALDSLTVRGPGTLKGGTVGTLTLAVTFADGTAGGIPVLDGTAADTVVVDFGADAANLAAGENFTVARYPADNLPAVGKWRVSRTGLEYLRVVFTQAGGEVRATVSEKPGLTLIVR